MSAASPVWNGGRRRTRWFFFAKQYLKLPPFLRRRPHELRNLRGHGDACPTAPTTTSTAGSVHWREIFRRFDKNGDGEISVEEMRAVLASMGEHAVSAGEVERAVGGELLGYGDFVRLMEEAKAGDEEEADADIRRAFEMLEAEKGSGCITPDGLHAALKRLGEASSPEDCVRMIRAFDVDGDGVIDYQEFRRMMSSA